MVEQINEGFAVTVSVARESFDRGCPQQIVTVK